MVTAAHPHPEIPKSPPPPGVTWRYLICIPSAFSPIETISQNIWSKSLPKIANWVHFQLTCVAQKRRCLKSLRKIAIFRRERSDDRKCVCCSQATNKELCLNCTLFYKNSFYKNICAITCRCLCCCQCSVRFPVVLIHTGAPNDCFL